MFFIAYYAQNYASIISASYVYVVVILVYYGYYNYLVKCKAEDVLKLRHIRIRKYYHNKYHKPLLIGTTKK